MGRTRERVGEACARAPRAASLLAAVGASVLAASAAAASPADPGAAIDVVDLPPLPEVAPTAEDTLLAAAGANEDVVTGSAKRQQSLGNVASAVTVISGDRLRRMGSRTVGEAIATAAGLYLVDDRLSTRVGLRGLQPAGDFNTRILVIIDGTTVTESWSHLSGVGYDLPVAIDEVERIEVIRGPVSSIYGTNAFFGIINIITRGPGGDDQGWARVTSGQIGGTTVTAGFALGTMERQLRGMISGTARRGEELEYDFDGPGSDTATKLARSKDVGAQLQFSLSGTYHGTFAQVRGYLVDRTVPFAPYESDPDRPYTQSNRQLLVDVGHVRELSGVQLSGRLFGNFYQFDDRATDPDTSDGDEKLYTIGRARTVGAEVQVRTQLLEKLGVTAGAEATYNDTDSGYRLYGSLKEADAGDLLFYLAGLYAEADAEPTSWLGLTAGLRIDKHSVIGQIGVSPRLAAFLTPDDDYGLKLLYASGFRYPSTYEREFDDDRDFVGNTELKPEEIYSAEMILWARPTATTWLRASVFDWTAMDIIKQKQVMSGDPGLQFQNDEAYASRGLELEASYRDRRGWLSFAGASLVNVRVRPDTEEETRPPNSPVWTLSLGVSSPQVLELFHVSSELSMVGERKTIGCAEECNVQTRPKSLASAFVGWNAAVYFPTYRGFDITLGMRNILGIRAEVPAAEDFNRTDSAGADVIADTVPGEGRELYVRIGHALP